MNTSKRKTKLPMEAEVTEFDGAMGGSAQGFQECNVRSGLGVPTAHCCLFSCHRCLLGPLGFYYVKLSLGNMTFV